MSNIDDLLAEEGAAAQAHEVPKELPEHVKLDRPDLGRPTVVSLRLEAGAKLAGEPSTLLPPE